MAPPSLASRLSLLLVAISFSFVLAESDANSLTGKPERDCKGEPETLKLCQHCEVQLGIALTQCCKFESVVLQCQNGLRMKRDVSSGLYDDDNEALFEALNSQPMMTRSRPFLGKRARPFLGKRSDSAFMDSQEDAYKNRRYDNVFKKKARPFLGKRSDDFGESYLGEFDEEKRTRPFLGKRTRPFLGKRTRPFLGKRDYDEGDMGMFGDDEGYKRARPFLGKRGSSRPFLGKRDDGLESVIEALERQRVSLEKRSADKSNN